MKKSSILGAATIACVAMFLFCTICMASCNSTEAKKINLGDASNIELVNAQELIVAIDSQEQYIEGVDNNSLISFNKDIARLISRDLSLNMEIKSIELTDVVSSVNEKNEEFDIALVKFNPDQNDRLLCSTPYYSFNINSKDKVDYVAVMSKNKNNLYEVINKDIAIRIYDGSVLSIANQYFSQINLEE